MNRELRRAQARSDKRQEREKQQARKSRPRLGDAFRRQSKKPTSAKRKTTSARAPRSRLNIRLTGIFALVTAFLIVMQSAALGYSIQQGEAVTLTQWLMYGLAFMMLGYFTHLWLLRRKVPNSLRAVLISGSILVLTTELGRWWQFKAQPNPLAIAIVLVGLGLGIFLARWIENTLGEGV